MIRQPGMITATGQAISEAKSHTAIQAWIRSLEMMFGTLYTTAAQWIKEELPEDFKVDINNDFGLSIGDARHVEALIRARQMREITRERFMIELRRRGILSENMDISEELTQVEAETEAETMALARLEADGIEPPKEMEVVGE